MAYIRGTWDDEVAKAAEHCCVVKYWSHGRRKDGSPGNFLLPTLKVPANTGRER